MKIRFNLFLAAALLLAIPLHASSDGAGKVTLKLMETTDVHGNFFGYDFIDNHEMQSGLPRVATFVNAQRRSFGSDACLLFDCGDVLQGQPCVYYANFVDTTGVHIASDVMSFLKYDAGCYGNHDIEAGHPVFDRWVKDCRYPVLGANIISTASGKPYALPYCVFERKGVKIAVLGLITPAIPMWLPENLWSGLRFEDIVSSAAKWAKLIREKEKPDVLVGLFHSGLKGGNMNGFNENAVEQIATAVPGFDIIFFGHDHQRYCNVATNSVTGQKVWLLNAGGGTTHVAEATLTCTLRGGKVVEKNITGSLEALSAYRPDSAYTTHYRGVCDSVQAFVSQKTGSLAEPIHTFDYFFGNSTMADLLHRVQLSKVKADISFITPLTFNDTINSGDICVKDIFKLYRYENRIDVFRLKGREVLGALEKSYDMWTNTMKTPADHALAITETPDKTARLSTPSFYLMSAAGISYEVDLTKPAGQKVRITGLKDGRRFSPDSTYLVAVNSYIGSGGGSLLTDGAGISLKELPRRIVSTSDKNLRYYIIEYFRNNASPLKMVPLSDWKFVPAGYVDNALRRDRTLLSGKNR